MKTLLRLQLRCTIICRRKQSRQSVVDSCLGLHSAHCACTHLSELEKLASNASVACMCISASVCQIWHADALSSVYVVYYKDRIVRLGFVCCNLALKMCLITSLKLQ